MLASMKNSLTDSVAILQDLIRCRSITPHEGGALMVLENLLSSHGFVCQRLIFKIENVFGPKLAPESVLRA